MDHNPYSPPQTEVREPVAREDAIPRPKQVTWAVRLFWTELALGVPQLILQLSNGEMRQYLVSCPVNSRHMYCSQFGHNRNGRDRDGDGATEGGVDLERG
jgi:hypothetical protein